TNVVASNGQTSEPANEVVANEESLSALMASQVATVPQDGSPASILREVLAAIAELRELLLSQRQLRDYYTTEQLAETLGRAHWTVREWCRLGRIHAEKRMTGRGRSQEWVISHAEFLRFQKE